MRLHLAWFLYSTLHTVCFVYSLQAGLEKLDSAAAVAPIAKPHGHGRDGHRSGQQREAVGLNKSNGDQKLQHLDLADLQNRFFATQSILNALKKETLTTLLEQMTEEAAKDKQVRDMVGNGHYLSSGMVFRL